MTIVSGESNSSTKNECVTAVVPATALLVFHDFHQFVLFGNDYDHQVLRLSFIFRFNVCTIFKTHVCLAFELSVLLYNFSVSSKFAVYSLLLTLSLLFFGTNRISVLMGR